MCAARASTTGTSSTCGRHLDFAHFLHAFEKEPSPSRGACTSSARVAEKSYLDAEFAPGDALVFGKESVGLPEELLARYTDRVVGIPTSARCAR